MPWQPTPTTVDFPDLDADLSTFSTEQLEHSITSYAGRIAAATALWFAWIAEFDRRKGWERWDQTSCVGWLNWKCGIESRTARDHLRVAHALEGLPRIRAMFAAGELSYSKVRALAGVANEFNEEDLAEIALHATANQLARTCAATKRREQPSNWDPMVAFENRGEYGRIVIDLPIDDFHRARQSVDDAADRILAEAMADQPGELRRHEMSALLGGASAIRSAAAAAMLTGAMDTADGPFEDAMLIVDDDVLRDACNDHSDEQSDGSAAAADDVVDNDAEAHSNAESSAGSGACGAECTLGSEHVPPIIARRIACDSRLQLALADETGDAIGLGRESRVVNRRLRRLLARRDLNMCRFPGCGVRRGLHAHHVIHWVDGGETELDNLVLVCHFHHRSLHEGGWNVVNKNGRFVFYDPHGKASTSEQLVDPMPGELLPERRPNRRPTHELEPLSGTGERMDLCFVVAFLGGNERVRRAKAEAAAAPRSRIDEFAISSGVDTPRDRR